MLKIELKRYNLDNLIESKNKSLSSNNEDSVNKNSSRISEKPITDKQTLSDSIETKQVINSSEHFSNEEITRLKEIIEYWNRIKMSEFSDIDIIETSIYIETTLLNQLTSASEKEGISRSKIIEKALKSYLNI